MTAAVSVHFFSNNPTTSYTNFGELWYLVDLKASPRTEASSSWQGISEGDLLVFSPLLTGAGEFESVRIAGPKTTNILNGKEEVFPLLTTGIEYPEFPSIIVQMAQERGVSLQDMYKLPFDAVLQTQNLTMIDVMGGEDEYQEFWKEPPVARRRRPPGSDPWRISLGECVWDKTLTGASLVALQYTDENLEEL